MENNSVRVFVVSDIHWDTDGEDIEIPKELTIQISEDEELEEDEIEEYISDKISDETGFCHLGFNYKEV
jgi:hypothetical protein